MKKIILLSVFLIIPIIAYAETIVLKSEAEFYADSQQICAQKWTKRGELDLRMYNHCMEGQIEGYKEVKHLHQYSDQTFYSDTAFPYCSSKWTKRGVSDARMMAHCLNQEVEGIKDIMYFRKQYGENKVNEIVGKALVQFHSWNMAAYKVRQYFE